MRCAWRGTWGDPVGEVRPWYRGRCGNARRDHRYRCTVATNVHRHVREATAPSRLAMVAGRIMQGVIREGGLAMTMKITLAAACALLLAGCGNHARSGDEAATAASAPAEPAAT